MKDTDLAWIAGFVDGEGCIGVSKTNNKFGMKNPAFDGRFMLKQKRPESLCWMQSKFGGSIHKDKRDGAYCWYLSAEQMAKFLTAILPYLRDKRDQAVMILSFQRYMRLRNLTKKGRAEKTPFEVAVQEWFYWRLRELKKVA